MSMAVAFQNDVPQLSVRQWVFHASLGLSSGVSIVVGTVYFVGLLA